MWSIPPPECGTETAAMVQWMIGETYFHQKDYEPAICAYLRVESLVAFPRRQAASLSAGGEVLRVARETGGKQNVSTPS